MHRFLQGGYADETSDVMFARDGFDDNVNEKEVHLHTLHLCLYCWHEARFIFCKFEWQVALATCTLFMLIAELSDKKWPQLPF